MLASEKHYRARITARWDVSPDLWRIRVDPGDRFSFLPGQYATLGVEKDARHAERPYSLVSSPREKELEFFFELVPEGETTPPLYNLYPGDELLLRKTAKGRFTLETAQPGRANHLLLSTVTGIAPFVSYARTLFRDWNEGKFSGPHKLFLLAAASRSWEFGYRDELEKLAAAVPWFKCAFTVSRPWEDKSWQGEVGRVEDLLRKYADHWDCASVNSVAYLCGHPQMIENVKGILKRVGFQKENLKEEVYWVPARVAAGA